jgi:hypothetical protein
VLNSWVYSLDLNRIYGVFVLASNLTIIKPESPRFIAVRLLSLRTHIVAVALPGQ